MLTISTDLFENGFSCYFNLARETQRFHTLAVGQPIPSFRNPSDDNDCLDLYSHLNESKTTAFDKQSISMPNRLTEERYLLTYGKDLLVVNRPLGSKKEKKPNRIPTKLSKRRE